MLTLEELKRKIDGAGSLQSVVKTMKALAAVNIRHYEKAVESLRDYNRTVELALQAVLRAGPDLLFPGTTRGPAAGRLGAVVFGSDQGMCGSLNDQTASFFLDSLEKPGGGESLVLAVGERMGNRLEEAGLKIAGVLRVPGSAAGIMPRVRDLLLRIERWNRVEGLRRVELYHSRPRKGSATKAVRVRLLPVDEEWYRRLRDKPWPTRVLPAFTQSRQDLFSSLVREYLFVSLFRALAESLASENASRLVAMQAAEKSIGEQLDHLSHQFHQVRQMAIMDELLDIASGFTALTGKKH